MKTAGYSGTPLARKLGIKVGFSIKLVNEPDHYFTLFSDFPDPVHLVDDNKSKKDLIHYFSINASRLDSDIEQLKNEIKQNGMIWISWPKKSSGVDTDLNGNTVRETGLRHGLVDVKVCAVDDTWSALKFVIPIKNRTNGG
jgi:hypothetical protein